MPTLTEETRSAAPPGILAAQSVTPSPRPDATAAAVSALVMAEQYGDSSLAAAQADLLDVAYRGDLSELVIDSIRWMADRQNSDGGWPATPGAPSDLTASLLVLSAFRLTCVPAKLADLEPRLESYVRQHGGVAAFRRASTDRATTLGVLTNGALAGILPWKQTPVIRFERAAAPVWLRRLVGNPQFNQNDPVLLSSGLARFHRVKPSNPFLCWARRVSVERCLEIIGQQQSSDGGFCGSTLSTSFVVMALAGAGRASHPIVRRAVEHLLSSVQPDATWHC